MAEDYKLEEWPVVFAEYTTAKAALQDSVAKERAKLDKANTEYSEAVAESPALDDYRTARDAYNAFRRWCESQNVRLTDPTDAVPGVEG